MTGCNQQAQKHGVDKAVNMVFNTGMNDAEIIQSIGGPAEVARLLGYERNGGTQRVFNWLKRGIPDSVKLKHQKTLLKEARNRAAKKAVARIVDPIHLGKLTAECDAAQTQRNNG